MELMLATSQLGAPKHHPRPAHTNNYRTVVQKAPVVKLDITADSDSAILGSSPGRSTLPDKGLWADFFRGLVC